LTVIFICIYTYSSPCRCVSGVYWKSSIHRGII